MPISPYNHEGYFDPTAYYALTAVDRQQRQARYRPIVCIIAPEGMDDNPFRRFAVEQHCIPLCPERMLADAAQDDSLAVFMTIALLSKCAELWLFGDVQCADAVGYARYKGKPVRRFTTECEEVHKHA